MRVSLVVLALFSFALGGCAGETTRFNPDLDFLNAMDGINRVGPEQSQLLVVATMTQAVYDGFRNERVTRTAEKNIPGSYDDFLTDLEIRFGLVQVANWPLSTLGVRCLVFESTRGESPEALARALLADPRFETAQALQTFDVSGQAYNDPYIEVQHSLSSMQVAQSHRWATGSGVTVAVIDTGMDIEHPDLKDRIGVWRNFVDQDNQAFRHDVHGTAVGAVIAATANNEIGMVGVAPNARIMALKACAEDRQAAKRGLCTTFTLAKSIDYAVAKDVDIINLSLIGPKDPLLQRLVRAGLDKGILVVGATHGEKTTEFPSHVEGVIAVAEPRAEHTGAASKLTIQAPGQKVLSASPGGDYDFYSGSSLSAAHVSGLVALLKERKPHISASETLSVLRSASQKFRGTQRTVNACLALAKLVGVDECSRD